LIDIINNITGGIIDFSITDNERNWAYNEVKINPRSNRYLNNVFLKAYYKFFLIDIINNITGGVIDFFQLPITEVSSAILMCDHPCVTEDR
jgi:hypothetical protein